MKEMGLIPTAVLGASAAGLTIVGQAVMDYKQIWEFVELIIVVVTAISSATIVWTRGQQKNALLEAEKRITETIRVAFLPLDLWKSEHQALKDDVAAIKVQVAEIGKNCIAHQVLREVKSRSGTWTENNE